MAEELQPIAEARRDEMAQINLHLVAGLCFRTQQNPQAALREFRAGVTICERPAFSRHADEEGIHVATALMTNLAMTEFDLHHTQASNRHARRSIAWALRSSDHQLHAINLTHAGGVLANNCAADDTIIQILEEARRDADSLNLNTYAVLAATYLMTARAERARFEREKTAPNDTPLSVPSDHTTLSPSPISPQQQALQQQQKGKQQQKPHQEEKEQQQHIQQMLELLGFLFAVLTVSFLTFLWWQHRQKRRQETMIGQLQEASQHRYLEGKEEERGRLAREMHDGVSNQLLAVQMKLQAEGLTPQTLQMLDESREQVRRLSHGLMPPSFLHTSLDEALLRYVAELNGANGCELTYRSISSIHTSPTPISTDKSLGIYRIVQEAVSNILKHAQATTVAMVLEQSTESVTVTIADNGTQPFCWNEEKGIGLNTMQERAHAIGAKIEVSTHNDAHLFTMKVPVE